MKFKVKHIIFLILFAIPFVSSIIYMVITQNGDGWVANIVVGYLIMFIILSVYALVMIILEAIILLVNIWNDEI